MTTTIDPTVEKFTARNLLPLLSPGAAWPVSQRFDDYGRYREVVETLLKVHQNANEAMATDMRIDQWASARAVWEGFRVNGDYSDLDKQIHTYADAMEIPIEPVTVAQDIAQTKPKFKGGITASDLRRKQFKTLDFVVEDILPEGLTLLAGKPKAKKSWLALNFALAVAMGGKAMKKRRALQGTVLYLDLESNQRRAQRRISATLQDNYEWPDNLWLFTEWPRLNEGGITALEEWMKEHPDTRLIVIDVFQDIRAQTDGKAGMYADDREAVGPLRKLAGMYPGLSILLIHHTRKAKDDDIFNEISGSTGLTGGVDNTLILVRSNENDDDATLYARGRDIEHDSPVELTWDMTYCVWSEVEKDHMTSNEQRDIAAFMKPGVVYTPKAIADGVGRDPKSTSKLLRKLLSKHVVCDAGYGRYKLVHTSDDDIKGSRSGEVVEVGEVCEPGEVVEVGSGVGEQWGFREVELHSASHFARSDETPCEVPQSTETPQNGSENGTSHTSHGSPRVGEVALDWTLLRAEFAKQNYGPIVTHCQLRGVDSDGILDRLLAEHTTGEAVENQ